MQLRGRHIQHSQNAHCKIVKRKADVGISKHTGINIKEVMTVTFSAMTHIIYKSTAFTNNSELVLPKVNIGTVAA